MEDIAGNVTSGISTLDLDALIDKKIVTLGLKAECKGYAGYKHASCISINDVIVHGVPTHETVLKSGDFVKIDVTASYKGYCADMARYFFIGQPHQTAQHMASIAQIALDEAIMLVRPGNRISDISACIQQIVEKEGYSVIRTFAGHGIGKKLHEEPDIPNFGRPGYGLVLQEGMALAIEPMIAERGHEVKVMGYG